MASANMELDEYVRKCREALTPKNQVCRGCIYNDICKEQHREERQIVRRK